MDRSENIQALCYGEMLWDVLPDGPQPGGAPMNVAYHLQKLGLACGIISRVGDDVPGIKLRQLLAGWGIASQLVQTDTEHPTGEVLVDFDEKQDAVYTIVSPAAWDFIRTEKTHRQYLNTAEYLIYGSLSCRNQVSKDTLLSLLEHKITRVFDINLREPYPDKATLSELLSKTDIVKFNQAELKYTARLFDGWFETEHDKVKYLQDAFGIPEVVVTRGGDGAAYYKNDKMYCASAPAIKINDTIGSGDAFLAAFIQSRHQLIPPEISINQAIVMGAFIATKKGGCPEYEKTEIENFKNQINQPQIN
ncbi:MAG TPA: PfkB family carbohydrate kinase [Mucilaginibacter sp.]|nr:PfkB family carbohydrate kinase [Mucilaginibacter sp.]